MSFDLIILIARFLIMLSILIMIHEAGHFFTARAFKVKVLQFGLGFPPTLFSIKRGDTVYQLNAIPLGGYVKLLGEEDPTHPDSLASKGALTRFTVLGAGAFMNLILAFVLFSFIFMVPQDRVEGRVLIAGVSEGSPAQQAGLQSGDIVLDVDGHEIFNTSELARRIQLKLGRETTWQVMRPELLITGSFGFGSEPGLSQPATRDTEPYEISLIPRWSPPDGEGNAGVQIRTIDSQIVSHSDPIWKAVPNSLNLMWEIVVLLRNMVTSWIVGSSSPELGGPIAIAEASDEVAESGWIALVGFMAFISFQLAIFNILPFPALDGGRILFVAIEWVRRGKRISPEKEGLVHLIGFAVLISFIAVISYFDVARIVQG